jgi:AmiR/NasT family two-component response regulator
VRCIERVQPDLILLDISGETHDPPAALMQLSRDRLDTSIIAVKLRDEYITIHCKGPGVTQKVGEALQAIQEAGNAACSVGRAKEVDEEERQDE